MRMRWGAGVLVGLLTWLLVAVPVWAVVFTPAPVTGVTIIKRTVFGDMVVIMAKAHLPASYAAAVLSPTALGMAQIDYLQVNPVTSGGYTVAWDSAVNVQGVIRAFSGGSGGVSASFVGDPVTPTFSGDAFTPTGVVSRPTFTVTKAAILANSDLGLSADATTATVCNNTIAASRTLGASSPVGVPSFTGDPITPTGAVGAFTPTGTINVTGGAGGVLGEVTGGTDLSAEVVTVIAYGH